MTHPYHPTDRRGGTRRAMRGTILAVVATALIGVTIPRPASSQQATSEPPSDSAATVSPGAPSSTPSRSSGHLDPRRQGVLKDLGRGFKELGSDAWYVVSSPARLNRRSARWLGATLAVGGVLYAYDEDLFEASKRNRQEPVYRQIQDVGDFFEPVGFMGNTNPFYIGAVGIGYAFRIRPLENIPAEILESHMIAGGLRNLAKVVIGRRRPNEKLGPRAFELNGGTSFPSGHSSVMFEVATVLSHHANRLPVTVACYAIAGTVALQRVDSGNHWASDVWLSAVSGTLIARTVVRRHDERRVALVPVVLPDGSPSLGVKFGF